MEATETIIRIVLTGPESTGKTELAEYLAAHYHTVYIPEYAREYISSLGRSYNLDDVLHVALKQVELENQYAPLANELLFYDTYLVITSVWLEVVFNHRCSWLDKKLEENRVNLYLLCFPDIPWIADGVRENGGEMRFKLFEKYREELERIKSPYVIIRGKERKKLAVKYIDNYLDEYRNGEKKR